MIPIRDTIPSRTTPWVTWGLIGVNAFVFLLTVGWSEPTVRAVYYQLGFVPARLTDPAWASAVGLAPAGALLAAFTSIFLHGGPWHLVGNMWTLWIFGDNVEDRMGHGRYLVFYLLSGLLAGGVHFLSAPGSRIPTVGASGAIAGVLGAYFLLFPRSRVLTVVPILFLPLFFELPAVVYLGFWFVGQLFSGTISTAAGAVGGVAWWAHVGGFVAGAVLYRRFLRPRPLHTVLRPPGGGPGVVIEVPPRETPRRW